MKEDSKELAEALDLEAWFDQQSLAYKMGRGRSGMQINACKCPSCGDQRYRVYLNAETGVGNCFKCNEGFNKLKFIHLTEGRDLENSADWASTFKDVREALNDQGWRPRRTTTVAVEYEKVKFPTSFELPTPQGQNLVYLENRGINGDMAKYFHLRMCVEGKWWFTGENGQPSFQKFDGRVIIPVFDLDGTFVTFQGRDITNTSDRKYLFPKGLPGTGRYLLNGQNALCSRRVCMGEGAFDVIATKLALDTDVALRDVMPVGSFGKSLGYGSMDGDDQLGRFIELQKHGLEEVVIMWDGEPRALVSALDAADLLTRIGLKVRLALLPADRDPNEVTPDVVCKAFWSAQPYTKVLNVKWRLRNPYA